MKKLLCICVVLASCATTTPIVYTMHETIYFGEDIETRTLGTYDTESKCEEIKQVLDNEARQMNPLGAFSYTCKKSK